LAQGFMIYLEMAILAHLLICQTPQPLLLAGTLESSEGH